MYFVSDSQKGTPRLKQQRSRLAVCILFCALLTYQGSLSAQSSDNWSFAVSGDSRNCGDIVMPGIAEGVRADKAEFYGHLGDYRANYDFDRICSLARNIATNTFPSPTTSGLSGRTLFRNRSIRSATSRSISELATTNSFLRRRGRISSSSLPIGSILQRSAHSDYATTRVITNFGLITIGFKEAWILSLWTMPPTTGSTMLRLVPRCTTRWKAGPEE